MQHADCANLFTLGAQHVLQWRQKQRRHQPILYTCLIYYISLPGEEGIYKGDMSLPGVEGNNK